MNQLQVHLAHSVVPILKYRFGQQNIYRVVPVEDNAVRVVMQEHENGLPFRIAHCRLVSATEANESCLYHSDDEAVRVAIYCPEDGRTYGQFWSKPFGILNDAAA